MAYSLLVSSEVTLYTLANPPFPKSFPRRYLCTVYPSPQGLFLCSIIVTDSDELESLALATEAVLFRDVWFNVDGRTGATCPVSAQVLMLELLTALRSVSLDKLLIALLFSLLDVSIEDE